MAGNDSGGYRAEDYEKREEVAITGGKRALLRAPWLLSRQDPRSKGFFCEISDLIPDAHLFKETGCTDGIGTKITLAALPGGSWRTLGKDGVYMNANDLAPSMWGFPNKVFLYFACQGQVETEKMGEIMEGIVDALLPIRKIATAPIELNIGKMETASLDEMIAGPVPGLGFDLGVVMTGYIRKDKVPNLDPLPGHLIVGVSSTGLHSNAYTGARHALLRPDVESRPEWQGQYHGRFLPSDKPSELDGMTVLEAMQVPTACYLDEAAEIALQFDNRDIYGVNITGNGLKNFNRAGRNVSFEITDPLAPRPINLLVAQESGWSAEKAYEKTNMGMGFAYIAPRHIAFKIADRINAVGSHHAEIVGEVFHSDQKELVTNLHTAFDGTKNVRFVGYTS
jgi:phosphoribosylformylglycinamidine cyclo-ligase